MTQVRIPERMPEGLPARDSSRRQAVQSLQPVRGTDAARLEAAIAHLAAGRPLPAPCCPRRITLPAASTTTLRTRIATPIVPRFAVVHGTLTSTAVTVVTLTATTALDTVVEPLQVGALDVSGAALRAHHFELLVEIGNGAPAAAANAWLDVTLQAIHSNASATVVLHSWGVLPLPFIDEVTT